MVVGDSFFTEMASPALLTGVVQEPNLFIEIAFGDAVLGHLINKLGCNHSHSSLDDPRDGIAPCVTSVRLPPSPRLLVDVLDPRSIFDQGGAAIEDLMDKLGWRERSVMGVRVGANRGSDFLHLNQKV